MTKSKKPTKPTTFRQSPLALTIIFILASALSFAILRFMFSLKYPITSPKLSSPHTSPSPAPLSSQSPLASPIPSDPIITDNTIHDLGPSAFTGQIEEIKQDLGIIEISDDNRQFAKDNNYPFIAKYYRAGTFTTGKYAGYTRVIGLRYDEGQGPYYTVYIFATKDFKTYVVNHLDQYANDYLDHTKISLITTLPTDHFEYMSLGNGFALHKSGYLQPWSDKDFLPNYSKYTELNFDNPAGLKLYQIKAEPLSYQENMTTKDKEIATLKQNYLRGTTGIIAVDSTGLAMHYTLTRPSNIYEYIKAKTAYDQYEQARQKSPDSDLDIVDYPQRPNLRIAKNRVVSSTSLYDKYDVGLPQICGTDINSPVLQNIAGDDLQEIGGTEGKTLYVLKDQNHPLYQAAYYEKITKHDSQDFGNYNTLAKPTFEEYLSKHPLLITEDYWGRYVLLEEWDYMLPGGCGKPVIYLYPQTPTKVSIRFTTPMDFDTQIPSHHDGWHILAHPNGTLTNLQPEFTPCDTLISKFGSEYAKASCLANTYPYIYWSGNSLERRYPAITQGWIVARDELAQFMHAKLDEVGLNSQEKSDMLAYWLPTMLTKNTPYYRISFLETREMNYLAPMEITPRPDTLFRIFLDYLPLDTLPTTPITPQTLTPLHRTGFTVIEWGGLKH